MTAHNEAAVKELTYVIANIATVRPPEALGGSELRAYWDGVAAAENVMRRALHERLSARQAGAA